MNYNIPMYRFVAFISGLFLVTTSSLAQEATFEGLGDLPGGLFRSAAFGVSANGSVVVGESSSENGGQEAFRWENGDMEGLGALEGDPFSSSAYDVSADGSVVVGRTLSMRGWEAFRWEGGQMEGLGDLPGGIFESRAEGVSSDGSVVVGFSNVVAEPFPLYEAFRWRSGEMEGLGYLPGGDFSQAFSVSPDGSVIIGRGSNGGGDFEALRWEGDGIEGLGDLPGGDFHSWAFAVSAEGSVVIGRSNSENGSEAFYWEAATDTMIGLGDLPDPPFGSDARAVSADGSIVVGHSTGYSNPPHKGDQAFIWTEEEGMRNLKEVLESDYGLDLDGWVLRRAYDISNDGTVIVGAGINPDGNNEGWRAFLGKPVADEATPEEIAEGFSLPKPNPIREISTFTIAVERGQEVAVEVFDVMGRRVQTLYEGTLAGGKSETLTLDALALPAGVYVVRATGEDFTESRRVTVVR